MSLDLLESSEPFQFYNCNKKLYQSDSNRYCEMGHQNINVSFTSRELSDDVKNIVFKKCVLYCLLP